MPRECVINELSIEDFGHCERDALELLAELERLREVILPARIWMWEALRQHNVNKTRENLYFAAFVSAVRGAHTLDEAQKKRLLRFFDKAVDFGEDLGTEVRMNIPPDATDAARGLGRAHRFEALALSLLTADRWNYARLPVKVLSIAGADAALEEREDTVRHAAVAQHVQEHHDWEEPTDADRLRVQLAACPPTHKSASAYRRHVSGNTNAERAANASAPNRLGQYFAERDGVAVTDETIRQWEERVLDRVRHAGDCRVEDRTSVVWIFCDLGETVGYAGGIEGDGKPTSWVRVEVSAATVHSHPRLPPREPEPAQPAADQS